MAALLGGGNTLKLTATAEKNDLFAFGGGGNDTLIGGAGNDQLDGGAGNDSLSGGAGANIFVGGAGADSMTGGAGIDTADYSASAAITVDLTLVTQASGGDANGDRLSAIENVIGTGSADKITGNSSRQHASAAPGGADTLIGGAGNDTLDGGAGARPDHRRSRHRSRELRQLRRRQHRSGNQGLFRRRSRRRHADRRSKA